MKIIAQPMPMHSIQILTALAKMTDGSPMIIPVNISAAAITSALMHSRFLLCSLMGNVPFPLRMFTARR